jgi:hypothetical protein
MLVPRRIAAGALAAAVLLTSFTLAGCSKIRDLESAAGMGDISQWTAEKMTQAFAAINAKIGANSADYEAVLMNEVFLRVDAIDPKKRENVDRYSYQGGSVQVTPVDVSQNGMGAIEANAFKGDTVKPAVLAQAMNSAPKDSGVAENPKIEWVQVRKTTANDDAPQIWVEIRGPRAARIVHYNLAGSLVIVSAG